MIGRPEPDASESSLVGESYAARKTIDDFDLDLSDGIPRVVEVSMDVAAKIFRLDDVTARGETLAPLEDKLGSDKFG